MILENIFESTFGTDLGVERFQTLFYEWLLGLILGIAFGTDLGAERFQTLF